MRRDRLDSTTFDLNYPCPHCGYKIPPRELVQFDHLHVQCPKCRELSVYERTETHCTTCDAIVELGTRFCGKCGAQLTAGAKTAHHMEQPRFARLALIVGAIGILLGMIYALSK
jgi:hypothetical protein